MVDIFARLEKNAGGPIGQYMSYAHGYYAFPKLEGDIGPHMTFRGKKMLNWSLNNYLGLANHPEVRKADAEGAAQFGMAAPMGARMMSGQTVYHERLERELAEFVGKEDAFLLNFGYQGMISIIDCLLTPRDVVVYDAEAPACLIDGLWSQQIGREKMEELFAYAKEKGVEPLVWYNSNGAWNDAPQGLRMAMDNPVSRKKEMKWLKDHGVKGIKVDFFAGDKQETMKLYEQILSDANDYGISVIFHGCTMPRGWERMYPNYISSEAVRASENLVFNQSDCDIEAFNAALHPFIRNSLGAMEFGGTFLQHRLNRNPEKGNTRRTGDIFQLATAILFQSAIQNFALTPASLTEAPQFEIDFMKAVPTTWDETVLIDGYPGRYVVLARRSADRWYVAAINADSETKKIKLNLPMLAGKTVDAYTERMPRKKEGQYMVSSVAEKTIPADGMYEFVLPTGGGAVLVEK